jgi:ribosomal protein S18 acetylase RimI-like enzyme
VIESRRTLSAADLAAIADLDRRVVAADGGRLKLEWGALRSRAGERPSDFLAVEDGRLLGFAGIYAFGGDAEIAGMVDPAARRRGLGAGLLGAVRAACRERGLASALLIVPRPSVAGATLAVSRGGALEHSEHALVLTGEPGAGRVDPAVTVRIAEAADAPGITRLLEAGFGHAPGDVARQMTGHGAWTELVLLDGESIGTLRLSEDGGSGFVHGFAIDPRHQGRGIGRDVLRRACVELRARGASQVALEVAVENERALGLYTSVGFRPVLTEDYYRLSC